VFLRKYGQEIIDRLGGKRIHPAWAVPGGVRDPISTADRDEMRAGIPEALRRARVGIDLFKRQLDEHPEEVRSFGNFASMFMGLVKPDGAWELYRGNLRIVDQNGRIVADQLDPTRYDEYIGEAVEPWSYLKFPFYRPRGYPDGMYRVGPLARLNVCMYIGTPLADQELAEFRSYGRGAVLSSFFYHYARLIEALYASERMEELLNMPEILDTHVRAEASVNAHEGVGIVEAPRGTLIHHYKVDERGSMKWANLIVATGHNNLAINRSVQQVAERFVDGNELKEGAVNRVSAVVRAYDPCLSCSTHAFGQVPMQLRLLSHDGSTLQQITAD
jgi:NAD-reducing hydrogenase large subunit